MYLFFLQLKHYVVFCRNSDFDFSYYLSILFTWLRSAFRWVGLTTEITNDYCYGWKQSFWEGERLEFLDIYLIYFHDDDIYGWVREK